MSIFSEALTFDVSLFNHHEDSIRNFAYMSKGKEVQNCGKLDKNSELAERIKHLRKNILKFSQKD